MKRVFVFGSNREGRHGKGAAFHAKLNHGAKYGQPEGLQGSSYAIVTKELRKFMLPVTLGEVRRGVNKFLAFAKDHPEMDFDVSEIGCGLAGFSPAQIGPLFAGHPDNVYLPESFKEHIKF